MNKKVILIIPTLSMGGGERVASELSLNLPESIERIVVLFKNEVFYPYKGKLISLDLSFSKGFLFKIYYFLKGFYRLKKIVSKEKPDYIIAFGFSADLLSILVSKNVLASVHSIWTKSHGSILEKSLVKIFFNKSKNIICVSKTVSEDLTSNFGVKKEKIKIIPNPIDVEKIKKLANCPVKPEYEEIFKSPVIINMGRFSEEKNHYSLIRAFKEVQNNIKTAKLVILGKGEKKEFLEQTIRELGLENSVYLLGSQDNPFQFLAKAKVFASSSQREGLPCSILEAMACGLPIISADCRSGPREILAPETDIKQQADDIEYAEFGILTPVFDKKIYTPAEPLTKSEKKLAEAIIKVLTDKKLSDALVEKSRQRAEDFDVKKIIKKWNFL